jgi:hypothetical protein
LGGRITDAAPEYLQGHSQLRMFNLNGIGVADANKARLEGLAAM